MNIQSFYNNNYHKTFIKYLIQTYREKKDLYIYKLVKNGL